MRIEQRVRDLAEGDLETELRVRSSRDLSLLAGSVTALAAALRRQETHSKELESAKEAAEVAKEAAEVANRAKSLFLANVTHELRTPLNAVLGFGQLLESDPDTPLSPEQGEAVAEILTAGGHLLQLVDDVLDLARLDAGLLRLTLEPVELSSLLVECLAQVAAASRERGLRLQGPAAAAELVVVDGDRQRIRQVLLSLLSNAIKFNRPQGEVRLIGPEVEDGRVRVAVEDTGPGLTPAQQQALFQTFSRLEIHHLSRGTGMGLARSKRLMDLMGGRIWVESRPGEGSRFWLELALVPTGEEAEILPAA
jgi:signal transduction histidine kinase